MLVFRTHSATELWTADDGRVCGDHVGTIEDALAPLRGQIAEDDLQRLIRGIGATLGIEAFVWLTDIAGVPREEAASIIRSNALGLLRSAMSDGAVIDS